MGDGSLLEVLALGAPLELEQEGGEHFEGVGDPGQVPIHEIVGDFPEPEGEEPLLCDIGAGHLQKLKDLGVDFERVLVVAEVVEALVDQLLHEEDGSFDDLDGAVVGAVLLDPLESEVEDAAETWGSRLRAGPRTGCCRSKKELSHSSDSRK